MKTWKTRDPLLKGNFISPFLTTRRNEILDLLANLVIFPAYVLCIDKLISEGLSGFPFLHPAYVIIWLLAISPMLSISGASIYWRLGFKGRKRVYAISLAIIITFLFKDIDRAVYLFGMTIGVIWLEFLVRRLLARRKLKNRYITRAVLLLVLTIIFMIFGLTLWVTIFFSFIKWVDVLRIMILLIIALNIPIPFFLGIRDSWTSFVEQRHALPTSKHIFVLRLLGRLFLYLLIILTFAYSGNLLATSLLGLALMLLLSGLSELLSRQRANFRSIFKTFRNDFIYRLISPTTLPSNSILIFFQKIKNWVQKNISWVLFIFALVIGGILLPTFLFWNNPQIDVWTLFKIGSISSVLLILFSGMYSLIQIRARHIVLPFVAIHMNQDAELDVVAHMMTYAFVDRLREITMLLNLRQVENLSLRSERGLAIFVTSGMDQDFVEQIRSLGNIETSEVKMPFGDFFGLLFQQWAETQVRGTLKRQDDNTIAIWVEFVQRGGRSFGVDLIILPDEATREVDSNRIGEMANILAVKLVAKLGFHSHLATSWESLRLFLDGLNAAYHRNWWQAIKDYQKAVHIEGTISNSFGYGYFHLGAVLMSQGEIAKGMSYLEHAESSGPPLAETQYMLALGLFYQNRDSLHINRTVFTDIEWRCKTALTMRPDFPEAHHLLGTAYYQRGRLRERSWTKRVNDNSKTPANSEIDPIPKFFEDDYDKARFHLQKSIKVYDQAIRRLPNDLQAQTTVFNEQSRLVQDRMAATHRLADALRCLKMYSEADSYYHELLVAYPRNNRTLVDLAKTYTLSRNWGKADEFLRNEVFNHPELQWNKSASFYMGWSQLGGLSESENPVKRLIDKFIHVYETVTNWKLVNNQIKQKKIFWNAICWLDFSIHQYPGYLYVWKQMNWLDTFEKVVRYFTKDNTNIQAVDIIYRSSLKNDEHDVSFLRYWLAWRILGNTYEGDENLAKLANSLVGHILLDGDKTIFPNNQFGHFYLVMQEIRSMYALRLEKDDVERNIKSIQRRRECLELGSRSYNEWKTSAGICKSLIQQPNTAITFGDCWVADVFADFSLLTIKVLIEGKAFEYAKQIATDACKLLIIMRKRYDEMCTDYEVSPLGGKVASYQLSMLYAWQAYSVLMMMDDVATLARLEMSKEKFGLDDVQEIINLANKFMSHNPLAAFSQALLYKRLGFYRHAADELNRLSTLVAPFDPHKYVTRDLGKSDDLLRVQNQGLSPDAISQLYKKERIHGRRQIDTVVNLANIHYALASVHSPLEEYNLVAEHLNISIGSSSYQDFTAELFLDLAIVLNQQEKFEEAITAVGEAMDRNKNLSRFQITSAKCLEPFVLECVLTTNTERYSLALEKAYQVKKSVDKKSAFEKHRNVLGELKQEYSNMKQVTSCLKLYETKLNKALRDTKTASLLDVTDLCLAHDKLAIMLEDALDNFDDIQELPLQTIVSSQLLSLLARDLFEYQVYSCDILNNIGFNSVELNFNLNHAKDYSIMAVDRMSILLMNIVDGFEDKSDLTKSISRQLNSVIDPVVQTTAYYEERLANYLDTQAWIYFKLGTSRDLAIAFKMLSTGAIKYGPHIAVIYYHLARVCISILESLWQAIPAANRIGKDIPAKYTLEISNLLRLSSLYWRQAMRLNRSGSLHKRLSRVHERLTVYRMEWELIYQFDMNYSDNGSS